MGRTVHCDLELLEDDTPFSDSALCDQGPQHTASAPHAAKLEGLEMRTPERALLHTVLPVIERIYQTDVLQG